MNVYAVISNIREHTNGMWIRINDMRNHQKQYFETDRMYNFYECTKYIN